MRVIVLGSGVIGVTSAYYLARDGHDVTVLDRLSAPALGTSYANAGQISPGYSTPWAAPGLMLKALKWLMQEHMPLRIIPDGSLSQCLWLWQMLRNCTEERYAINKYRMLKLSEYSRDCLRALRAETGIHYENRQQGTLQLFRDTKQLNHTAKDIAVLQKLGVPFELYTTPAELIKIEPGLAHARQPIIGGLRLPDDETGDCHLFTVKLAKFAADLGVKFQYGVNVDELMVATNKITAIRCGNDILPADQVIVALGVETTALVKKFATIPVYPVKGYSLTLPILDVAKAPSSTVLDETYKIAITRFDERIRVGGMAEICGYNHSLNPKRHATLAMVVDDLFPGAGDLARAEFWTGLRAMTPNGVPIVGATVIDNLYLNTGHGSLGWTMACGCAQLVADMIAKRETAINKDDYRVPH